MPLWYPLVVIWSERTNKLPYQKFQYPTYVKDIDLDVHIRVFKKAIRANEKFVEANIINMLAFNLQNNISKWGENFVQDHFNCTFEKLEQGFYKKNWTMKNDKEVYM